MSRSGSFRRTLRDYTAFFPTDLPPELPINMDGGLSLLLADANRGPGAINTIASILPNPELLVALFIQKEALLSSQIEGTQSSLVDVLAADEYNEPTQDVGEVVNYIHAMLYISAYLKTHQQEHFDRLQQVRTDGNFAALFTLVQELDDEEHRALREGLDEESLAIFDLLKKPDFNAAEIRRIKAVAV